MEQHINKLFEAAIKNITPINQKTAKAASHPKLHY